MTPVNVPKLSSTSIQGQCNATTADWLPTATTLAVYETDSTKWTSFIMTRNTQINKGTVPIAYHIQLYYIRLSAWIPITPTGESKVPGWTSDNYLLCLYWTRFAGRSTIKLNIHHYTRGTIYNKTYSKLSYNIHQQTTQAGVLY